MGIPPHKYEKDQASTKKIKTARHAASVAENLIADMQKLLATIFNSIFA